MDKLIYFGKEAVKQRKVWILGDEEGFMELGPDKPSGTEIEFTLPVYSSKELAGISVFAVLSTYGRRRICCVVL